METCNICGGVHQQPKRNYLNVFATKEELDSLDLILNRRSCITQALNVSNIPQGETNERIKQYIDSLITLQVETKMLEKFWWEEILKKYSLPKITYVDLSTGEFYSLGE